MFANRLCICEAVLLYPSGVSRLEAPMTRRPSLVFLTFVLSLLATNACAGGMARPNFAGAYIGAAVGFGGQRVQIDNETMGTEFRDRESSVALGGYAGYNWFYGQFTYGIEADFNYLNTSPTAFDIATGPTALTETTSLESRMDWFGTLRARAGVVIQQDWLLYATGGLAYAQINHTLSDDCVGCGNSVFNLGPFTQSDKDRKVGWTAGGGMEFLHDSHWRLRAEALYVDLGSKTHGYIVVAPAATATSIAKWDDQFWVVRLGLAYALGAPQAVVSPK
jgi:outer membrane immunogenic protein